MADRVKIQVLPLGEWLGHPEGAEDFTRDKAEYMVNRANALVQSSGNPIQIDYDHMSLRPPADGAPASGWMYSFTLENDGIYADVEWTERAKNFIDNKEYRYISPVVLENHIDPVTGEVVPYELFNAALTNQPFMHDKIKQVVASVIESLGEGVKWFTNSKPIESASTTITRIHNNGGNMAPEEIIPAMAQAIGLPAEATAEDLEGVLKAVKQFLAIAPGAPEGGALPTPEQMGDMEMEMKKQAQFARNFTDLAQELGVETSQVIPHVKAMSMTKTGTDATEARIKALEAELEERKIADMVLANSSRIAPAERENVKAFAKKYGLEAATEMVSKLPELPGTEKTRTVENAKQLDDVRMQIAKKQGISPDTIKKFSRTKEA